MQDTVVQPAAEWVGRVAALLRCGESGPSAIARFLPPPDDPLYTHALSQLVKADLRSKSGSDRSSAWAEYRQHFPSLPDDEPILPTDRTSQQSGDSLSRTPMPNSQLRTNATRVSPVDVVDLQPLLRKMPRPGESFGTHTIVDELGRGAFGRVYLATEHNLADRLVALKVTRRPNRESQKLARLQHTNIVPIHSAFQVDGWHVVQMPFFGRQTLADLLETVREEKTFPDVSREVFATTEARATTARKTHQSSQGDQQSSDSNTHPVPVELLHEDLERRPTRELLAGLTYNEAAIWIIARLADGLSHAHEKNILHLDLKPHNVLLSDDGQPMLLDFNLSYDVARSERDRIGGTWPYMSPEQICEYARRPGAPLDARSDLYSLGVMFFEMLTLRHPFPPVQTTDEGLDRAIEARKAGAPDVREFNPQIPPSIAAVVAKLLEPSPLRRYQSANELRDDLRRHADNRPLTHARDRSVRERLVKLHRRNPRLSLTACVAVLGLGLAFTVAQLMSWSRDRERVAAEAQAALFLKDHAALRVDLTSMQDAQRRRTAFGKAGEWLTRYSVGTTPDWTEQPALRMLAPSERASVQAMLGEMALLAAQGEWVEQRSAPAAEPAAINQARRLLDQARAAFGHDVPAALRGLEAELQAGELIPTDTSLSDDPADLFARGVRLVAEGSYRDAATLLARLTELQPDHFAGQFALGVCYEFTGQTQRAMERFQVAKPLGPNDARPSYHRGVLLFYAGRLAEAEADFSEAIRRDRTFPGLHLQRAFTRKQRGKHRDAIDDLTTEIQLPQGHKFIALVVRADLLDLLGEPDRANADRAEVDSMTPTTSLEYVARGSRWLPGQPHKALADFDRALELNPMSYPAMQNKAHVYADILDEPELALGAMKKLLVHYAGMNKARAGHAVLLARLGKRQEAHAEAETALMLGSDPEVTYQAACVYAITAASHPEDRDRSLALFRACLRDGYRKFAYIRTDRDMANVLQHPEFQRALTAAIEVFR